VRSSGIIGRSAGKTTLLETLVGLLPADAGDVLWHGEPLPAIGTRNALFICRMACAPIATMRRSGRVVFAGVYGIEGRTADTVTQWGEPVLTSGATRRKGTTVDCCCVGLLARILFVDGDAFDGFDLRQTREIVDVLRNQPLTADIHSRRFTSWSMRRVCAA